MQLGYRQRAGKVQGAPVSQSAPTQYNRSLTPRPRAMPTLLPLPVLHMPIPGAVPGGGPSVKAYR